MNWLDYHKPEPPMQAHADWGLLWWSLPAVLMVAVLIGWFAYEVWRGIDC